MKISSRTLNILKNFSTINNSLLVRKGNVLDVVSREQNVIGLSEIEENFPSEFAIYDLTRFLGAITLFDEPDFDFDSKSVRISNGKTAINYVYCDSKMVPDTSRLLKNVAKLTSPTFSFKLNESDLQDLIKASAILELPEFSVVGNGETLRVVVSDVKNPSSNTLAIDLNTKVDTEFKYVFKCQNLKLLPGNYEVDIHVRDESTVIGHFKHNSDLSYYVVVEDVS